MLTFWEDVWYNNTKQQGGVFMTDTTWSVRMPVELREKISQLIEQTGLSSKDLVTEMVQIYELNRAKEVLPVMEADIKELQEITKRINAIFINAVERVKTMEDSVRREWQERLVEKEKLEEKYRKQLAELQEKIRVLHGEKSELFAAKQQLENDLKTVKEMNDSLKALVKEYEAKFENLQLTIEEYRAYVEENGKLKEDIRSLLAENERLMRELKEKEGLEARYRVEIKNIEERANLEKERAVLAVQSDYEKKISELRSKNENRVESLLQKIVMLEERLLEAAAK
jgi:chromosome segregation ATPase